jgi:hypothetical protein
VRVNNFIYTNNITVLLLILFSKETIFPSYNKIPSHLLYTFLKYITFSAEELNRVDVLHTIKEKMLSFWKLTYRYNHFLMLLLELIIYIHLLTII